jgi:hypothetical protein
MRPAGSATAGADVQLLAELTKTLSDSVLPPVPTAVVNAPPDGVACGGLTETETALAYAVESTTGCQERPESLVCHKAATPVQFPVIHPLEMEVNQTEVGEQLPDPNGGSVTSVQLDPPSTLLTTVPLPSTANI